MASVRKCVQRVVPALTLCLFSCFVCSAGYAQDSSAAAPRADSKTANNAEFLAAADEVLQQMSEITGLKLVTPLKKSLRSREEIRAYVIKQMNEEKNATERYADARTAEAFGLIPKDFDLDAFMVNVLTEQIEGLYDPKSQEFYIADWSAPDEQRMVMAHELTHALEDQHFHIEAWSRAARPNEDAELARDAVLEGSAMAAMVDYLMQGTGRSLKDLPEFDPSMLFDQLDMQNTPALKSAPTFLKDALIFPYISGLNFSAAVLKNSGWPALAGVFENPPVSTQEILHPQLYKSRRADKAGVVLFGKTPSSVSLPSFDKILSKDWAKLDENILGEFGWKEVLKQFLDDARSKSLAAAWDGDRYVTYEQKETKKLILVTRLHLDSEEHATRFFGQYSEALEKKHAQRSNLMRRPNFFQFDTLEGSAFLYCFGEGCVTMEGGTRKLFDAFTKALEWPSAPPPSEHPSAAPEKTALLFFPAAQAAP